MRPKRGRQTLHDATVGGTGGITRSVAEDRVTPTPESGEWPASEPSVGGSDLQLALEESRAS